MHPISFCERCAESVLYMVSNFYPKGLLHERDA